MVTLKDFQMEPNEQWVCHTVGKCYQYSGEVPEGIASITVKQTGTTKKGYPAFSIVIHYIDGHLETLQITHKNSMCPRTRWTLSRAKLNVQCWLEGKVAHVEAIQ